MKIHLNLFGALIGVMPLYCSALCPSAGAVYANSIPVSANGVTSYVFDLGPLNSPVQLPKDYYNEVIQGEGSDRAIFRTPAPIAYPSRPSNVVFAGSQIGYEGVLNHQIDGITYIRYLKAVSICTYNATIIELNGQSRAINITFRSDKKYQAITPMAREGGWEKLPAYNSMVCRGSVWDCRFRSDSGYVY